MASSGRGAADISAAVAELDQEHARQHARSGERRRRGADRPANGGDVVQAAPSSGRAAADISAAVAELEEHAGEVDRGERRRRGADRAELEVRAELGPRRGGVTSARRSPSTTRSTPARSTAATIGGDVMQDRAELEVRTALGPRRGRVTSARRSPRSGRAVAESVRRSPSSSSTRSTPARSTAAGPRSGRGSCRARAASGRGSCRARAASRPSDISAAVAELDQEHAGEVDRGDDRRRRDAGPRRARARPSPNGSSAATSHALSGAAGFAAGRGADRNDRRGAQG